MSRNKELVLLLFIFILNLTGFYIISPDSFYFIPLLTGALFLIGHLALRILCPKADFLLFPFAYFLLTMGLLVIFRLNSSQAYYQLAWLVISIGGFILLLILLKNPKELEEYKYLCVILGISLLLLPIFYGVEIKGARLWLKIGSFSFQPVEVAKILLVIFLSAYLKEKKELLAQGTKEFLGFKLPEPKHFGPLILTWSVSLAILIFIKDLGFSFLFLGTFLALLYIATNKKTYLVLGIFLFLSGATTCYLIYPHVSTRINIWITPWHEIEQKGYQIVQSLFALANGGILGTGLKRGYPYLIPASSTDFIFSSLCEELGFLGGFALILTFLLFSYRGFRIALSSSDEFIQLLASGITIIFSLQTFIILGGVTKLIPLTGLTLPFVSYGGSSLLSNFLSLGILLSLSKEGEKQ